MSPINNQAKDIAIVMDSLDSIKPKKDSTVAMIQAAHKMGARIFYMGIDDLFVEGDSAKAVTRQIHPSGDSHDYSQNWCKLGNTETRPLTDFDVVLMRKDPPVDKRFIHACYMLEHAARNGARVLNNPAALVALNEKLFATHFSELCPPTVITSDIKILRDFLTRHKKIIIKPLDAMGGAGVFMVTDEDVNFEVVWEIQTARGHYPVIAQSFLPAIQDGDIRVIVINGKAFEHVLVRTPKTGSIRGNMAAGGNIHVRPINDVERSICEKVGPILVERGIVFAGIDIIGDRLIEINITSPTGLREISNACGIDVAEIVIKEILA